MKVKKADGSFYEQDVVLGSIRKRITAVPGDVAEFGVFRGTVSGELAKEARAAGRTFHAFDSFEGLGEPSEHDEQGRFLKGGLNNGGRELYYNNMKANGFVLYEDYVIYKGFIPNMFDKIKELSFKFSFCYIDLDHYGPTLAALEWACSRMTPGGLILCDDYFDNRDDSASKAIKEFIHNHDLTPEKGNDFIKYYTKEKEALHSQILLSK